MINECKTCKRRLNIKADPFSNDCGGDCISCQIEIELYVSDYSTALTLALLVVSQIDKLRINEIREREE